MATMKIKKTRNPANFEKVAERLQAAAADAVAILHAGLWDGSASTRIRTAVAILNLAISEEIKGLENRLSVLERRK
jgi:hypothetical protein